jgi:hypothetical protein
MLRRPLYAGRLVWNQTQKITRKGTKAQRKRDASEWLERQAPELAIIDADLWQRVQARRETAASTFVRRMNGRLIGRPAGADVESPYLLSGIAQCGLCGGSVVAMTRSHGSQRVRFYGCMRYHKRGVNVCRNGLQIRQDVLDAAVIDVLAKALDADVIAEAVDAAVSELTAFHADAQARRESISRELDAITTRERRLVDALVDGDVSAGPIRDRLRTALARRDALTAELSALVGSERIDTDVLVEDLKARAADARALLGRSIPQARQMIRRLLDGRLVCEPIDDGAGRGYAFTALGTYRQLLSGSESVNVGGGPNGIRTRVWALPRFRQRLRDDVPRCLVHAKTATPQTRAGIAVEPESSFRRRSGCRGPGSSGPEYGPALISIRGGGFERALVAIAPLAGFYPLGVHPVRGLVRLA